MKPRDKVSKPCQSARELTSATVRSVSVLSMAAPTAAAQTLWNRLKQTPAAVRSVL